MGKLPIMPPADFKNPPIGPIMFKNPPIGPIMPPNEFKNPPSMGHGSIMPPAGFKEAPTEKVVADSDAPPNPHLQKTQGFGNDAPVGTPGPRGRKPLPALQYVNQHLVKLQYEIKRHGPSGIGSVEIWLTRDDGASWEPYAKVHESEVGGEAGQGKQE